MRLFLINTKVPVLSMLASKVLQQPKMLPTMGNYLQGFSILYVTFIYFS